ncbi:MAG: hypothetical protein OEV78_09825 [Spirochaetia bacterium]|nr:hypothetical protein [Spirochaetia bacterium]
MGYRFGIIADGSVAAASSQGGGGPAGSAMIVPAGNNSANCPANTQNYTVSLIPCYYTDSLCSIPAPPNTLYIDIMPGGVVGLDTTGVLYYVDKAVTTSPTRIYSVQGICTTSRMGYIPTVNNPTITGVSTSTFALPITIINQ